MGSASLSGSDTIIINGRVISDLADDDVATLTFPNDIATLKTGKNGNSLYALNETGKQADFKLRVLRGGSDDKFLNGLLAQQQANFAGFPLLESELIKQVGDGTGRITKDTYILGGGIFSKLVEAKSNVGGDTGQALSEYMFKFSNAPRAMT